MKEYHLFYAPDIETTLELPKEEACHAVRVLRMSTGDPIHITDGNGHLYEGEITEASQKHCRVVLKECFDEKSLWKGKIHLAVAPTKNMDRIEWLAEKATEIGIDQLSLLLCERSERKQIKPERIDKILISAMKQSHKYTKPQLESLIPFDQLIQRPTTGIQCIAHCYEDGDIGCPSRLLQEVLTPQTSAQVLIGPEGDFSIQEVKSAIQQGYIPVSLGKSRLRTETAALVATHLMYLSNQLP